MGLLCALGCPRVALAQATGQLWGDLTIDWLTTERLTYEVELQPQTQRIVHDGQPTFIAFDATPRAEYTVAKWIDVVGEAEIGRTIQSNDVDTTTVTPRVGAELHILSRILQPRSAGRGAGREKLPLRRLVASTLLRLENESTFFSTDASTKSSWQLRDRFGVTYPLNRPKTTVDGAIYLASDGELFFPLGDASNDGLVNQVRVRTGFGYRRSFAWRFETLYVWIAKRDEQSGVLSVQHHALDIRARREF